MVGGRPLTGYHSFIFFLPILVFHYPFVSGLEWSLSEELMVFSMYFSWTPLWDYLWFIYNPAYGIENFHPKKIWWHSKTKWIIVFPVDYVIGWSISLFLAFLAGQFGKQCVILLMYLIFINISVFFLAPRYRKWRINMGKRDDRDKAEIFHNDEEG